LENPQEFVARHIGLSPQDEAHMLSVIGEASRASLIAGIVPANIRRSAPMDLPPAIGEAAALAELRAMAAHNRVLKSFIGQGYYGTHTPGVILRNILENPAWYTAYTPYQAEISQGRMEALVNFQTMVCDLTAMPIANASMLDEATAAAEAMTLAKRSVKNKGNTFLVGGDCHPQTIAVIQTRAAPLGMVVKVVNSPQAWYEALAQDDYFGAINQYPGSTGWLDDWQRDADLAHSKGAALILAADLLALTLLKPPGEMGADIVVGSTQPTAWRCRPASNTYAAKKPRPIFVPRKCYPPSWPACMRCITALAASRALRSVSPPIPLRWLRACPAWAARPCTTALLIP